MSVNDRYIASVEKGDASTIRRLVDAEAKKIKVATDGLQHTLYHGDIALGHASVLETDPGDWVLRAIEIEPGLRGQGLGTLFLSEIAKWVRKCDGRHLVAALPGNDMVRLMGKVFGEENVSFGEGANIPRNGDSTCAAVKDGCIPVAADITDAVLKKHAIKDVARDAIGRVIPLERRFRPCDDDGRKSDVETAMERADWAAAFVFNGEGDVFRDNEYSAVVCTGYACQLRQSLGDRIKIMGFFCEDNPGTKIEEYASGHDFAVLDDRFIIDPWIKDVECFSEKSIYDLENPADCEEAALMYGDSRKWTRMTEIERQADKSPTSLRVDIPPPPCMTMPGKNWQFRQTAETRRLTL